MGLSLRKRASLGRLGLGQHRQHRQHVMQLQQAPIAGTVFLAARTARAAGAAKTKVSGEERSTKAWLIDIPSQTSCCSNSGAKNRIRFFRSFRDAGQLIQYLIQTVKLILFLIPTGIKEDCEYTKNII
ncbi:uncharacterized protein ASCRUDRAFT_68242 [Ascoidea rubescens DSM 1968]|uniref:Uncharacterized protein n=1 Tax=Ascoidea rubescens DSM 1968 TaxID=1344418 RepID=A0A1D2VRJ1_9ASCO|nr:hypothetical protein ASCRUDRAFT_68242 [Ascoidea rubescens DSM 1968]ODV64232.1 hypothetical protein ASCRUDRAFT_68242 [Ascoidea rubescens DSM 1968]